MRRAMWLAGAGLLLANLAMAKPPELPARPEVEGRVPVYPDGEKYQEPAARPPSPRLAPKTPRVEPPVPTWWPLMNLLLPPLEL